MLKKIYYKNNLNSIISNLNSRKEGINKEVNESVEKILEDVKNRGDKALIEYAEKFDGFTINNM